MSWITAVVLTAVLSTAVWTDSMRQKIPNKLILVALVSAFSIAAYNGLPAVGFALAGLFTGFALFLPAYAWAGMGAGDVKLMAAVGAFLGPQGTIITAVATITVGAVLGILILVARGGVHALAGRYWSMLMHLVATRQILYVAPQASEAASGPLPYAIPIALGTAIYLWHSGFGQTMFVTLTEAVK